MSLLYLLEEITSCSYYIVVSVTAVAFHMSVVRIIIEGSFCN
jgi:hypothetical protein